MLPYVDTARYNLSNVRMKYTYVLFFLKKLIKEENQAWYIIKIFKKIILLLYILFL